MIWVSDKETQVHYQIIKALKVEFCHSQLAMMKWLLSTTNNGCLYMCTCWTIGCALYYSCPWPKSWVPFEYWELNKLCHGIFVTWKRFGWTNIATHLVAFGVDNVSVFQGVMSSATKQFERHAHIKFGGALHFSPNKHNCHRLLVFLLVHLVKECSNPCITTFAKAPSTIWNSQNWLTSWKPNA
jgi:hypothetical protein